MPSDHVPHSGSGGRGDRDGRGVEPGEAPQRQPDGAAQDRLDDHGPPLLGADQGAGLEAAIDRAGELPGLHRHLETLGKREASFSKTLETVGERPQALVACRLQLALAEVRQEQASLLRALGQPGERDAALGAAEASLTTALEAVVTEPLRTDIPAYAAKAHARLGLLQAATGRWEQAGVHFAAADTLFETAIDGQQIRREPLAQLRGNMTSQEHAARLAYANKWHYGQQLAELRQVQGDPEGALRDLSQLRSDGEPLPEQHPGFRAALLAVARSPNDSPEGIAKEFHNLGRDPQAAGVWLRTAGRWYEQGNVDDAMVRAAECVEHAAAFAEASGDPYVLAHTGWTRAVVGAELLGRPRSSKETTAMRRRLLTAHARLDGIGSPAAATLAAELRSSRPGPPHLGLDAFWGLVVHPDEWAKHPGISGAAGAVHQNRG